AILGMDVCIRKPLVVTCGIDKSARAPSWAWMCAVVSCGIDKSAREGWNDIDHSIGEFIQTASAALFLR
ncbi:unnamed protein product, partial [Effrenium voratum]